MPSPEEAALEALQLFRESAALGDLSLALALLDRDATLVDALVPDLQRGATAGELILELRIRHAEGVGLELLSSEVAAAGEGAILIVSRLALIDRGEDGTMTPVGTVDETALLVLTPQGWRIRHLHRSLEGS